MTIRAYVATAAKAPLKLFEYDPGPLGADEVEIAVEHCGICHSDMSMIDAEWGPRSSFPLVPGHEVVGRVKQLGPTVKGLALGDRVGLGWISGSCQHCDCCLGGHQHLCLTKQETIVRRHGGFADTVRCQGQWAIKLPEKLHAPTAGPLFCGGVTVFSPMQHFGIKPTDRVGVVGIGGLGHLAIKFMRAWGCEVTAFTSSESKRAEAMTLGAHRVVSSSDKSALKAIANTLDYIIVTVNVPMDWSGYVRALRTHGRLHFVGAVLEPLGLTSGVLMSGQKQLSASPVGGPLTLKTMLEFAARHDIRPQVEMFPMSKVNEAIEHLRAGKARYRLILNNDF